MILAETDACTRGESDFQMDVIIRIFRKNGASEIQRAGSPEEAEALWQARKSVGSAAAKLRPNNVSEDVTIPVSRVPDLLTGVAAIVQRHGLPFVIFGHAGDGNLHPRIMFDRSQPDQVRKVQEAVSEIFRLTCSLGGSLSGEHGIGLAKAPFMPLEHDQVAMGLMRSLKRLLDPNNILNPGKLGL
jgi:glycolate oxidase